MCSVHFIQFLTKQTQVTGFLHKICVLLIQNFKINSNIFSFSSNGTTDDTVLSLAMFKSEVYSLFSM